MARQLVEQAYGLRASSSSIFVNAGLALVEASEAPVVLQCVNAWAMHQLSRFGGLCRRGGALSEPVAAAHGSLELYWMVGFYARRKWCVNWKLQL